MFEAEALEFPWMANLPKREKSKVTVAKEVLQELTALQEKVGSIVPVILAAGILNVTRQRVMEMGENGQLKIHKAAGHLWVSADELVEFAKKERKAGRPPKLPTSNAEMWQVAKAAGREMMAERKTKK